MSPLFRVAVVALLVVCTSVALADGIEPGLWKIVSRTEINGVMSPPQESAKCLTPEQTRDLAATFSPALRTINSECGAIERSLDGDRLKWKLICTGQLDMELTGDYTFRDQRQYAGIVRTRTAMGGRPMSDTVTTLYAERVSECP